MMGEGGGGGYIRRRVFVLAFHDVVLIDRWIFFLCFSIVLSVRFSHV